LGTLQSNIFDSLETYKDLFDNAHDLIHIVEPEGILIYVNKAWEKLLGYSQEEVQGKSLYSFVDEPDRDRFIRYRESIVKGDVADKEIVISLITKSGKKVFLEGFVSAKFIDSKPLYTRGIFRDITAKLQSEEELKQVNEELRARESNLQQLLFHAPDAVVVIDAKSNITYWNPKAAEIFGWSSEEAMGKPLSQLIIPHQYREAHDAGMKRYLQTGEAHVLNKTIEITALNKTGREFYVSLTISTAYQRGEVAFIAFVRDIDEQKRNALELEQKKVQLELSNQELERFAHVASHDMKEPVRKIRIFAERLKDEAGSVLASHTQAYITKIESAASRLSKMVDGVLAYSSVNAQNISYDEVDLNEVIRSIETDLELIIQQTRAVIRFHNLPTISGAPILLYQLFYNLINNALKFSKPDVPPVVDITAARALEKQLAEFFLNPKLTYVEITVRDNGIGFAQHHADKIFKSFTRLHSKDRFEGTGIGLSLCKTIVEKHHGVIKAYGQENEGATFVILLPEKQ